MAIDHAGLLDLTREREARARPTLSRFTDPHAVGGCVEHAHETARQRRHVAGRYQIPGLLVRDQLGHPARRRSDHGLAQ